METEDPKLNLKKALDNWAEINKKNTEIGFIEGRYTGALVSSAIIDKFATWLLAGSGATAALMIANLDKLSPIMGGPTFKQSIYLLVISALFGFLAKYKSIYCQIMLATGEEIKKRVLPILETHGEDEEKIDEMAKGHDIEVKTEMDLEYVSKEYCSAFPKFMHYWLIKQFKQGLNDRLAPSRKAANSLFWQENYTLLQFFAFLGFVFISVQKINGI